MNRARGIYKYIYKNEVIYVGKSDSDIISRIKCHSREEKFKPYLDECEIYYSPLTNAPTIDIYETYYINKYKPILNEAKKSDEEVEEILTPLEWRNISDIILSKESRKDREYKVKQKSPIPCQNISYYVDILDTIALLYDNFNSYSLLESIIGDRDFEAKMPKNVVYLSVPKSDCVLNRYKKLLLLPSINDNDDVSIGLDSSRCEFAKANNKNGGRGHIRLYSALWDSKKGRDSFSSNYHQWFLIYRLKIMQSINDNIKKLQLVVRNKYEYSVFKEAVDMFDDSYILHQILKTIGIDMVSHNLF